MTKLLELNNLRIKKIATINTPSHHVVQDICYIPETQQIAIQQWNQLQSGPSWVTSLFYLKKINDLTKTNNQKITFKQKDLLFTNQENSLNKLININGLHRQTFKHFYYNNNSFWIMATDIE